VEITEKLIKNTHFY